MSKTPQKPETGSPATKVAKPQSSTWDSRIAELFADPEFRLEWDNDVSYHVARNLLELRRLRGMTQAKLAAQAGTTQPRVALVESGDANVTLKTLEHFISALDGRLQLSIEPREYNLPRLPNWWDWPIGLYGPFEPTWQRFEVVASTAGGVQQAFAAWAGAEEGAEHATIALTHHDALANQSLYLTAGPGGPPANEEA
ncbi:MAG: helix-turn-helix domain-containing protein [Gemmatimonadales bacterium]